LNRDRKETEMGQKTERIKELEAELTAARLLLRHIGDTLGIEFEPPTTTAEAMKEHQRFTEALRGKPFGRSDGVTTPPLPSDIPSPRRRIKPVPRTWDTFDDEVDHQIDRMEAEGLTKPRETGALVRRDTGDACSSLSDFAPTLAELAPTIQAIAGELGLNVNESRHDEALTAIHEEILRVKNLGGDVEAESGSKFLSAGKSLGQCIAHDHAQAEDLRDAATQARTIVARLAAVMQIGTWDKDGTELLERAQKWETWKYELMKRIRELRASRAGAMMSPEDGVLAGGIAVELQRQLDILLSPRELQNWLKSLERAGATVKVDAAAPPVPPYPFEFARRDLAYIANAFAGVPGGMSLADLERHQRIHRAIIEMGNSLVASEEFARTMNLVILPILARQRAAQKVPDSANPG
jgi:hypothetical protein